MQMNYFVLGTNNMLAAVDFYDSLLESVGIKQVLATDRMTYWQGQDFAFAVAIPFNEEPATHGNGTMLGFAFDSAEEVIAMYEKVLVLGGSCEGEPNQRGPYFSAYVRDLDNNKLNFGCIMAN